MKNKKGKQNVFGTLARSGGILCKKAAQRYGWVEESFTFDKKTGKQVAAIQSGEYVGSSVGVGAIRCCNALQFFYYQVC